MQLTESSPRLSLSRADERNLGKEPKAFLERSRKIGKSRIEDRARRDDRDESGGKMSQEHSCCAERRRWLAGPAENRESSREQGAQRASGGRKPGDRETERQRDRETERRSQTDDLDDQSGTSDDGVILSFSSSDLPGRLPERQIA